MKTSPALLAVFLFAATGCKQESSEESGTHSQKSQPSGQRDRTERGERGEKAASIEKFASAVRQGDLAQLADLIYDLSDQDLPIALEPAFELEDLETQREILITLYEETRLRPDHSRLPLLLEIARQPGVPSDLRATILAELGTALQVDHGMSWANWATTLEETLANKEGLLRISP